MEILSKYFLLFLQYDRFLNFLQKVTTTPIYMFHFILFNSPLFYTIINNTFDWNSFLFSYIGCGIVQGGVINAYLYYLSDVLFHGKQLDIEKWKKTVFYDLVIYNGDSTYIYTLGSMAYMSLKTVPVSIRWTLEYPDTNAIFLQLCMLFVLHDFFFYGIHYYVHKIQYLRMQHLKWHHDCPFDIGSSRCAIATEGFEGLLRDIYSAVIPTYIISYCGLPFYGYNWLFYYSVYSFWAMYIHTGVNVYHKLHHSVNSSRNYGLYYLSDAILGTLDLREKSGHNE